MEFGFPRSRGYVTVAKADIDKEKGLLRGAQSGTPQKHFGTSSERWPGPRTVSSCVSPSACMSGLSQSNAVQVDLVDENDRLHAVPTSCKSRTRFATSVSSRSVSKASSRILMMMMMMMLLGTMLLRTSAQAKAKPAAVAESAEPEPNANPKPAVKQEQPPSPKVRSGMSKRPTMNRSEVASCPLLVRGRGICVADTRGCGRCMFSSSM